MTQSVEPGAYYLRTPRRAVCSYCGSDVSTTVDRKFLWHRDRYGEPCARSSEHVFLDELAAVFAVSGLTTTLGEWQ